MKFPSNICKAKEEDSLPSDNMSDWTNYSNQVASEYADTNNLTVVNIGGGISNREELGTYIDVTYSVDNMESMDYALRIKDGEKGTTLGTVIATLE